MNSVMEERRAAWRFVGWFALLASGLLVLFACVEAAPEPCPRFALDLCLHQLP